MAIIPPEAVMEKVAAGRPYILLLLRPGKPLDLSEEEAATAQLQHLSHLFTLESEGKISVFGPVIGTEGLNGIIIFNTSDRTEVEELMANDPHIKGGYLTYELFDFFSIPGQTMAGLQ